jgi:hypothetical protein
MYFYTREWKEEALVRFLDTTHIKINELKCPSKILLFQLREADRLGSGKSVAVTAFQKEFQEKLLKLYQKSAQQ